MTDASWSDYGTAAASQVAAAIREILADTGVAAEFDECDDSDVTCAFKVRPTSPDAAPIHVTLGDFDARITVGSSSLHFEWLDIVGARNLVGDVVAGMVEHGFLEWGPPWRRRGRLELHDGSSMHIGAGKVFDVWCRFAVRRYEPYATTSAH